jgi:NAD(P)-dependent dehydrogenase (short-subunit alcohol dehydrogenase family)
MASATQFRLDGKAAVITGAGSGIGRAIALSFAAAGATVHLLDLNLPHAERVAKEIADLGGNAKPGLCDVTDQAKALVSTFW